MKQIPLSNGSFALVDDEDAATLSPHNWHLANAKSLRRTFYASNGKLGLMHRIIMRAPKGSEVDHIDGNGLNNCRDNLRIATRSQNARNRGVSKANKVGFKGVSRQKGVSTYRVQIRINGVRYSVGNFADAIEAALAYDEAATRLHGEFACTNKSLGLL